MAKKTYTLTGAASFTHKPQFPERTTKRAASFQPMDFDVLYMVYPTVEAMFRALAKQENNGAMSHLSSRRERACK